MFEVGERGVDAEIIKLRNKIMIYTEFSGKNGRDEFKRELIAEKVINLLTSDINISPMMIDGNWGSGKTEFCLKLINKFKTEYSDYRLLYIDAFQADHADNPLMTILSSVINLEPEEEKKKELIEKAIPVIRYGVKAVAKAAVSHVLKINTEELNDEFEKIAEDAADKAIDASVKNLLKEHENAKKDLEALQKILEELAEKSPIIIFIDELDRCRPDFAVQMIETIKHTFDITGVKFVLVTNSQQLTAAIHHRYGEQVDARRYLDKFIKFSFSLSEYIAGNNYFNENRELASTSYFYKLIISSSALQNSFIKDTQEGAYKFAKNLVSINKLSLRETETFVRYLEICHGLDDNLKDNIIFGYQLLYTLGVFIFSYKPDIAKEISANKFYLDKIMLLLGWENKPDFNNERYDFPIIDIVGVALAQHKKELLDISEENLKIFNDDWHNCFRYGRGVPSNPFAPIREIIWNLQLDNIR